MRRRANARAALVAEVAGRFSSKLANHAKGEDRICEHEHEPREGCPVENGDNLAPVKHPFLGRNPQLQDWSSSADALRCGRFALVLAVAVVLREVALVPFLLGLLHVPRPECRVRIHFHGTWIKLE